MRIILGLIFICLVHYIGISQCYYSQPTSFWSKGKTTGVQKLDNILNNENILLNAVFGVNIDLYVGGDAPNGENAYFSPNCQINGCIGEIWLGKYLMSSLFNKKNGLERLKAVFAHEYAHALQQQYGWGGIGSRKELHADYLAGYYIGFKGGVHEDLLESFVKEFFSMGDTEFLSPYHHGTPEERACAFIEGYTVATQKHLNMYQAYLYGLDYVSKDTPCISFISNKKYDTKPKTKSKPIVNKGDVTLSTSGKKYYRFFNNRGQFICELGPGQFHKINDLKVGSYSLRVNKYNKLLGWTYAMDIRFNIYKDMITHFNLKKGGAVSSRFEYTYTPKQNSGNMNLQNGIKYFREGKYSQSIPYLNKALKADPDNYNIYFFRALSYSQSGNRSDAISDYLQIIKNGKDIANPQFLFATVYNNLGYCYLELGNFKDAEKYINIALSLNKYESYIWGSLGELKYLKGDYSGAIGDFTEGLRLSNAGLTKAASFEGDGFFYHFRGLCYSKKGNYQLACKDFNKALSLGYKDSEPFVLKCK